MKTDLSDISCRAATATDLPRIVEMLADDMLGRGRESVGGPLPGSYADAFRAIETDANNELLVACIDGQVAAMLQLTYTPSLSFRGSWRATVEGVRTASELRGRGIGATLMLHAVERARARNCVMVQLSTNKARIDARRFYERLGFTATHEGMKLMLR